MSKKIFLVDDSATMLSTLKTSLMMNGFEVDTACDGVDALSKLKAGAFKPDLIITDVNMPNMDGLELIKNLRSLPAFRFMPILIFTTESQSAKREEGKKLGATGWLVKPTSAPTLVGIIKEVLPGA
ncbi:response regulator [Polynucleobacter sp. MWH-Mekk-B1]|uniref:Two-component system sensor histidine kinase/response regulator n=1 Tax=Polynucleobacter aenigmaticus TaxID=1743164 RepID=A0A254Q2U4_9BURK|nr:MULTISPECIES: response regulator [Polynucleobacter]MBU3545121.1 response regulator [Polynucleobacter finlandensis]OWS71876.1 two-component system sensor histidine kinase/response regulator [Polynucleobacter aenigmaticus]